MNRPVRGVHVVVPARDEEAHLPACLDALAAAGERLHVRHPLIPLRVTVLLDACTDGSADVVARHPWVDAVSVDLRLVGAVRAAGVRRTRELFTEGGPVRVVCTDADSVVPEDWLSTHVDLAAQFGLVTGTVLPDDLDGRLLARWLSRHQLDDGHPHVHGANLGFDLDAYEAVGGFAAIETGEDVDLVQRMRAAGVPFRASGALAVRTSGRRLGRAPAGFAGYLLSLGA